MMKKRFDLDTSVCIGCGACSVACMDQNDYDTASPYPPFRTVGVFENGRDGYRFAALSMGCMHCADAPCIKACPSGCIRKDESTGFTVYDNTNCIGCHSCAMACPFGAPRFNADGKMIKCDGCIERVLAGMEPACVRACPFDALRLLDEETFQHEKAAASLSNITDKILEQLP